jgi:glycosyltransferase involved in cell wall biosynthesis
LDEKPTLDMNKKLSVVVISGSVGKNPEEVTGSFVFDEVHRLAQRGIEVHVVRSKLESDTMLHGIHFHGIERKYDIQAINLLVGNIPRYPPISLIRKPTALYWENLYAANIIKVVEKNNIDLIHTHFAYPEGLVGLLAKGRTGKPLVVTVHGCDILVEPSIGYGIRLSLRLDSIVKKVLKEADAVITASGATFNESKKIVGNTEKVYLIPNGVDINRFNPSFDDSYKKKLGISDRVKVVFTLRAHEPIYGIEYLLRAAPLLKRNDVIFVIGGDGSLRAYHERLAVDLGIRDRTIFVGKISRKEVPYYYAMSDIVVVPSLQEAFGLVVSEALACGKPVIGTKVGGIPDQIIDGYNGFLVKPKDPIEIAKKILWLLEHPEEAKQMGMNGRKIVEQKFNLEKRINRLIEVYENVILQK